MISLWSSKPFGASVYSAFYVFSVVPFENFSIFCLCPKTAKQAGKFYSGKSSYHYGVTDLGNKPLTLGVTLSTRTTVNFDVFALCETSAKVLRNCSFTCLLCIFWDTFQKFLKHAFVSTPKVFSERRFFDWILKVYGLRFAWQSFTMFFEFVFLTWKNMKNWRYSLLNCNFAILSTPTWVSRTCKQ